jgi:hypothetical protein
MFSDFPCLECGQRHELSHAEAEGWAVIPKTGCPNHIKHECVHQGDLLHPERHRCKCGMIWSGRCSYFNSIANCVAAQEISTD